jgi:protoporphyrinogen oxidase
MDDVVILPSPSAVIVGGGMAGLTLADKLSFSGIKVLLLEKEEKVGGLARSMVYGDFVFDIGPKRFHTYSTRVEQYLRDVLGSGYVTLGRKSSVFLLGKLHQWPLASSSLLKLPPDVLLRCLLDLFRKPPFDGESFSSYIVSRYGRTLYEIFFRDYTQKFCHVAPECMHESWARASIHRAIIDRRYQQGTLFDVAKVALLPKRAKTRFLYPAGGMDRFNEALVSRVVSRGGMVRVATDAHLVGMPGSVPMVRAGGQTIQADRVFWSGPVTTAYEDLLGAKPRKRLQYLSLALFHIEARGVNHGGNQWTYFSSPRFVLTRTSYPVNFDQSLVPRGMGSITAEVTLPEGDQSVPWADWEEKLLEELEAANVCARSDVQDVHRELIPYAYPLYELDYQRRLKAVCSELEAFPGLSLIGRTGKFWYNNMDDSIGDAMTTAAEHLEDWRPTSMG